MKHLTWLTTFLMLAGPVAWAGNRSIERSIDLDADGTVTVEVIAGRIEVKGWDRPEVRVSGTIDEDDEELEISGSGSRVRIEVEPRRNGRNIRSAARLEIHVPRQGAIEIETISADIRIDFDGRIEAESISGNIEIRGQPREILAGSVSGKMNVDSAGAVRRAEFETVSGNVRFAGELSPDGRYSFESVNGTIVLELDRNTSARFNVETFSGNIDNELGPPAKRSSEFLPAQQLSFTLGKGEARVTAESFNGTVRLLER